MGVLWPPANAVGLPMRVLLSETGRSLWCWQNLRDALLDQRNQQFVYRQAECVHHPQTEKEEAEPSGEAMLPPGVSAGITAPAPCQLQIRFHSRRLKERFSRLLGDRARTPSRLPHKDRCAEPVVTYRLLSPRQKRGHEPGPV
jgi:hypothetical protein